MSRNKIFFNDVLPKVADILSAQTLPPDVEPLVIRDIHGRIRIALDMPRSSVADEIITDLDQSLSALGAYSSGKGKNVLCGDDFFDPNSIFNSPEILQWVQPNGNKTVRILNRLVTGQDWDSHEESHKTKKTRLVFFGIKGGVGRSTALAILAYKLANSGKKVLLIDLDLESPGLSGLLLPQNRLADFGVVDWLIEDALGQGDEALRSMISVSPLSEYTQGEIRIAAAMGIDDTNYLDKLSRAYGDVAINGKAETFTQRIRRLVDKLEETEQPDVVLIDSRAGLHDLAAVSIVGLATTAFLFATDTEQSWQGYRLLFSHWQSFPKIARNVRERLAIVQALFPEADQSKRARHFLEQSYQLFSETLYEEIPPSPADQPSNALDFQEDLFNFDIEIENAPHYPLRINWNNRFQEFDPKLLGQQGLFSEAEIEASFGNFMDKAIQLIGDAHRE
ncbi:MAG: AAA family ATPase [Methylococcaceae bacterium]|nr:AAA family ATPase [Methylococcaceae bacterium]MDP3904271.1 AAA family ATPase [Methylococcaceae bacterium]